MQESLGSSMQVVEVDCSYVQPFYHQILGVYLSWVWKASSHTGPPFSASLSEWPKLLGDAKLFYAALRQLKDRR